MKRILLLLFISVIAMARFAPEAISQGVWTQKADFGGTARTGAVSFSIGNKGYVGTGGHDAISYKDFWEYNPLLNSWTQKADFGGTARVNAIGFCVGNK